MLITSLKPDKRGNRGSKIGLTMRSKTEVELDRKLKSGGLRTEGAGGAPEDAEEFHAMGQALKMAGLNLSLYPKVGWGCRGEGVARVAEDEWGHA